MAAIRYLPALLLIAGFMITPALAAKYSFGLEDNGKTVNISPGDSLSISLSENPSTGYLWETDTDGGLYLKSENFRATNPGGIGSGGKHTWNYLVTGTGTMQFSAINKQPWMPTTGDENTYLITFNSERRTRMRSNIWERSHSRSFF